MYGRDLTVLYVHRYGVPGHAADVLLDVRCVPRTPPASDLDVVALDVDAYK